MVAARVGCHSMDLRGGGDGAGGVCRDCGVSDPAC